ncbi:hypothetical protein CSC66_05095 [Pseudoxanthomonas kaohsiungensis]|nr:hypothetical protein CSC66_05095 [Pseudoxanthomonas kaohsiungensis]
MTDSVERIEIALPQGVAAELRYLVDLLSDDPYGAAPASIDELCNYVMTAVADGSRRPGSWERGLLDSLGLVSQRDEHHVYRPDCGPPRSGKLGA